VNQLETISFWTDPADDNGWIIIDGIKKMDY
jgi:hypothetical protein